MVFLEKVVVVILSFCVGVLILRYTEPIVRTFGKSSWAEQHLGAGGSYTMWKVIGILVPVATVVYTVVAWH